MEALKLIRASPPDMVLLDCELSDMTGFDVLRSLTRDERPLPIMVADDDRHAVEALELAAIDYLTRPVSAERFDACSLRRVRTAGVGSSALKFLRRILAQVHRLRRAFRLQLRSALAIDW